MLCTLHADCGEWRKRLCSELAQRVGETSHEIIIPARFGFCSVTQVSNFNVKELIVVSMICSAVLGARLPRQMCSIHLQRLNGDVRPYNGRFVSAPEIGCGLLN